MNQREAIPTLVAPAVGARPVRTRSAGRSKLVARELLVLLALLIPLTSIPVGAQQGYIWRTVLDRTGFYRGIECADSLNCMTPVSVGFAIEYDVLRTTDGGLTWSLVYVDTGEGRNPRRFPLFLHSIAYPDPNVAVVAADSGFILRTTDGGTTWERIRLMQTVDPCHSVSMYDRFRGAVTIGYPHQIVVTDDGWETSRLVPDSLYRPSDWIWKVIYGLRQLGRSSIIAVLGDSVSRPLVRTTDGGRTWSSVGRMFPDHLGYRPPQLSFIDSLRGWVSMYKAAPTGAWTLVGRTNDGGLTWTILIDSAFESVPGGFGNVSFSDELHGIAASYQEIMRTSDGGRTWSADSIEPNDRGFFTVVLPRGNSGLATAASRSIFKYMPVPPAHVSDRRTSLSSGSLYPNPARSSSLVRLRIPESARELRVTVNTLLGTVVRSSIEEPAAAATHEILIDLAGLTAGCYVVRFEGSGVTASHLLTIVE